MSRIESLQWRERSCVQPDLHPVGPHQAHRRPHQTQLGGSVDEKNFSQGSYKAVESLDLEEQLPRFDFIFKHLLMISEYNDRTDDYNPEEKSTVQC